MVKGKNGITKEQKALVQEAVILLDKEDVKELTGWGENTIDQLFACDEEFPAIKIGKSYQVELSALKTYFSTRRTSKNRQIKKLYSIEGNI